jgi:hypothetical protein
MLLAGTEAQKKTDWNGRAVAERHTSGHAEA